MAGVASATIDFAEAAYNLLTPDGRPLFVPTLRYDMYEGSDGTEEYTELSVNLAYFVRENLKVFLEYWNELGLPDSVDREENNRWTMQFEFGL